MKAVLLAAGLGSRLGALTRDRPKCMVEVAGRPVLEHNLGWLRRNGVEDVFINLHHRPETVVEHFGDGTAMGIRITYSFESRLLGTAGTIRSAASFIEDEAFLIVYADNMFGWQLFDLVGAHREASALLTVALFERSDISASGVAIIGEGRRITSFVEKPRPGESPSRWTNAGLMVSEPRVIDWIPAEPPSDLGRDVLPRLVSSQEVVLGYPMGPHQPLYWIDTPADLLLTEERLRHLTQ